MSRNASAKAGDKGQPRKRLGRGQFDGLVLEIHPAAFTIGELFRDLSGGGSTTFPEVDANERAVRDLAGAGLLHRPVATRWSGPPEPLC
jgi:hypothetical protein